MKKLVTVGSLIIIIALLAVGCTGQPQVEDKVEKVKAGVVDQDKVWTESKQAKKYQEQLNEKIAEVQKEYKTDLEGLSDEEKVEKHQDVYKKINKLREDLRAQFKDEVKEVIGQVADEKDLDIVLNKQDVKYGGTDITDEVIKKLD